MNLSPANNLIFAQTTWQKYTVNIRTLYYLRKFLKETRLGPTEQQTLQLTRLRHILIYAYENFEFYRDRFHSVAFDPYSFTSVEQIEQIPVLTKDEYRSFTKSIIKRDPDYYTTLHQDATSGSTGKPLQIIRTWDEWAYMIAKWMRVLHLNGYRISDKTYSLTNPHRLNKDSLLQNLGIMKRYMVSQIAPVEDQVSEYLRIKPDILYGGKSLLLQMALFARKNGIELPHPRFYICAAETLDSASRNILTGVFGCNLGEVYASTEFNILAWRNTNDACFNFSHTTNLLELSVGNDDAYLNGRCIITDFFIRSFPLIRYELGDYLEITTVNGMQVVNGIFGRINDWIVFGDGGRCSFSPFWKIIRKYPEILQFRVIQESLKLIRILLVRDTGNSGSDIDGELVSDLRKEIGEVEYRLEWIDELPPDPNGKLRVLISKI